MDNQKPIGYEPPKNIDMQSNINLKREMLEALEHLKNKESLIANLKNELMHCKEIWLSKAEEIKSRLDIERAWKHLFVKTHQLIQTIDYAKRFPVIKDSILGIIEDILILHDWEKEDIIEKKFTPIVKFDEQNWKDEMCPKCECYKQCELKNYTLYSPCIMFSQIQTKKGEPSYEPPRLD